MSRGVKETLAALFTGCTIAAVYKVAKLHKAKKQELEELEGQLQCLEGQLQGLEKYSDYQNAAIRQFESNCSTEELDRIYSEAYEETYKETSR